MTMKVKTYDVLCRAIEEGVERGYRRAHKHTDTPEEDHLKNAIVDAIMLEICGVFIFDNDMIEESYT